MRRLRQMAIRVTVVSDSHLSDRNPGGRRHWDAVVEHLAADPPDLVVHAGDASRRRGRARPSCAGPPGRWTGSRRPGRSSPATTTSTATWRATTPPAWPASGRGRPRPLQRGRSALAGAGRERHDAGPGSPAEAEQWDWLEAELRLGPPVAWSCTSRSCPPPIDGGQPRALRPRARPRRLLRLLAGGDRAPGGGVGAHPPVLQHERDGIAHVWAPATWATSPTASSPRWATRSSACWPSPSTTTAATRSSCTPSGRRRGHVGVDVDDPYGALTALGPHPPQTAAGRVRRRASSPPGRRGRRRTRPPPGRRWWRRRRCRGGS